MISNFGTVAGSRVPASSFMLQRERGVALAILVWFIAAMSLIVGSIVMQARVDVKLAQLHAARARVEAVADGAIQLALADLLLLEQEGDFSAPVPHYSRHEIGETAVTVSFTPLAGLVGLNQASEELLFLLFSSVEDVDENVAQELAFNVVEWRSAGEGLDGSSEQSAAGVLAGSVDDSGSGQAQASPGQFKTIEELLLVPGIDRRIYGAVRDALYVSDVGQSGVDWMSAPVFVLQALGDMGQDEAVELASDRSGEESGKIAAPAELDLDLQEASTIPAYRIDAFVKEDSVTYRRRRWVDRSRQGSNGLPWLFFRTEAVTAASTLEQKVVVTMEDADGAD